jgi:hypothetical protein
MRSDTISLKDQILTATTVEKVWELYNLSKYYPYISRNTVNKLKRAAKTTLAAIETSKQPVQKKSKPIV